MVKIIRKRQIIALSLVVLIVVAGYLQYSYNKSGYANVDKEAGKLGEAVYVDNEDLAQKPENTEASAKVADGAEVAENLAEGKETAEKQADNKDAEANKDTQANKDAQANKEDVAITTEKEVAVEVLASKEAENYFAQTKLEKEISRSKETDKLGSIAAEESASEEIRDLAYSKMMAIINNADKEMRIEALIKKQGFGDVIAFFAEDGSVDIVVKSPNLSSAQVTQIADIVTRHANIDLEMVKVKQKF